MPLPLPVRLSPAVAGALRAGRPVVALESTIISHGMPYPANLETALAVEDVVRQNGAEPATIAVVKGEIRVGLDGRALETLAADKDVVKASSRDLAIAIVKGQSAGTTVSATMVIAAQAGIRIFATGGIGGVHRGAETTFDISADLSELGRTPVAVVCAGVKSILDIAKTLEYLETQRVPVIAHAIDDFPAFYARSSGHKADHRLDNAAEIARTIALHMALGTGTGLLIANPIPESHAIPPAEIDSTIAAAVREAAVKSIGGKELTPFLLARIAELTQGRSLAANIALIRNNAAFAARVASELAAL